MTEKLPKEASNNDLACNELGGWRPVGAALQNFGVGACDLCDGGHGDRRWSIPDQQRLVHHLDDSHGKRGDTDRLFSWNVDSTWRSFAIVTQVSSLFEEGPQHVDLPDSDLVSVHLRSSQAAVPSGPHCARDHVSRQDQQIFSTGPQAVRSSEALFQPEQFFSCYLHSE